MNLISKLLPPANIVLDLEVSSKKRMFEQAGLIFENNQGLARSLVFDSLFARENLGSTGLGQGVAIPHGRIKGLREAVGGVRAPAPPRYPSTPPTASRSSCCSCCWYRSRPPNSICKSCRNWRRCFPTPICASS